MLETSTLTGPSERLILKFGKCPVAEGLAHGLCHLWRVFGGGPADDVAHYVIAAKVLLTLTLLGLLKL
jgi:hypothetical protein